MLKTFLGFFSTFVILALAVACSNGEKEHTVTIVTIIDMSDIPVDEWFGLTILAESERGQIVFDHDHLDDIGATIGDTVKIVTEVIWRESLPMQVHVKDWSLVE